MNYVETKKMKYLRWRSNFTKLLFNSIYLVSPPFAIIFIICFLIIQNNYYYIQIISSVLEIFGVLIVFLSEVFSSSFKDRWYNPIIRDGIKTPFTQTTNYVEKDGKRHYYYIGTGRICTYILYKVSNYISLPNYIGNAWYWLFNEPNPNNCKINYEMEAIREGSIEDLKSEITDLKKYPNNKIFGYFIIFTGFIIQFIYVLISKT